MPSEQFENMVTMFKAQRTGVTPTIPELRQGFDLMGQMMPPVTDVEVTELEIAGMPADRLVPVGADESRVLLYLHGGGYCIGTRTSHRPLVSNLAKAAKIPVLLPEYRLGPEHPFPAAVTDGQAAYEWVLKQGFAPDQIFVAGESAGGGLTVAVQVALRDAGVALPAASIAISPWCDLTGLGDVSDEALDIDFLRPEQLILFADSYAGSADRSVALCSPVNADLSGLPPMLIQVGEAEILLDQGRRLAAQAKDCGVDVTLEVEPGMFHAWPLFAGALPEADAAIARIGRFIAERV